MDAREFQEAVLRIFREDHRFSPDAYPFVVQALTLARRRGDGMHASAAELLESFRAHAWTSYGPQAGSVLRNWGVHSCEDVGEIVHILTARGILHTSPTDDR